jgi:hypothetical protein
MSLNRRNPRRDTNEAIIVQALEARGFHVDRISGAGIPDLLVSKHGSQWLIEIKRPKGKYTPAQVQWRSRFQGPTPRVLRTVDDALAFPDVQRQESK